MTKTLDSDYDSVEILHQMKAQNEDRKNKLGTL